MKRHRVDSLVKKRDHAIQQENARYNNDTEDLTMTLDEVKAAVRLLTPEDRRKVALYILELEKDHFQDNVGPQIAEDLKGFTKVVQETIDKIKKNVWPTS